MSPYPSDENVALFRDFTQCSESAVAVKFLQGANNVLDAAVNNYFENPARYDQPYQDYDESAFGQSRYGNEQGELPSFQIDPLDNANVYSSFSRSTAPTRPNSRNSNSSMKVLTDQQESGIVGVEQRFGPARRDHYDNSQWSLTVPDSHAAEIYPDVEMWDLVRQQGEPVFLKPQNSVDALPALLSIVGRIPLVQQIFLGGPPTLSDYGSDLSWWSGTTIHIPRAPDADDSGDMPDEVEFLAEVQRLLVFLHWSDRLYGSVEALETTALMHATYSSEHGVSVETEAAQFLRACSIALGRREDGERVSGLFRSRVVNNGMEIPFEELNIILGHSDSAISLYEAVDRLIWESDPDGIAEDTRFLSEVAPVLVLHLKSIDTAQWGLNVNIPSEWYLDRYMEQNKDVTKQMRKSRLDCQQAIQAKERQLIGLQSFQAKQNATVFGVNDILQGAVAYLGQHQEPPEEENGEDFVVDQTEHEECSSLSNRLQRSFEQLQLNITKLHEDKADLERQLERLSEVLQPGKSTATDTTHLKHKYILRGVSTKTNNVYVPMPVADSDEEAWWKTEYEPTPIVDRRTLSLPDVLDNASRESREILLVYASESAGQYGDIVVPDPLLDFVKRDNEIFKASLEASRTTAWDNPAPDYSADPPPYGDEDVQEEPVAGANSSTERTWDTDPSWQDEEQNFDYDQEMKRENHRPPSTFRPDGPV